jgi:hypothetical protein
MVSTWNEYLRLDKNDDGTATLEICQYECLAEVEHDEDGNELPVSEYVVGKKVVGVEDGCYIVGGVLACYDDRSLVYGPDQIDLAVEWLKTERFQIDDDLIAELRSAVH